MPHFFPERCNFPLYHFVGDRPPAPKFHLGDPLVDQHSQPVKDRSSCLFSYAQKLGSMRIITETGVKAELIEPKAILRHGRLADGEPHTYAAGVQD